MKALLLVAATLLLAGCGGVSCENPASDAATTRVDERLVGFWRMDLKASGVTEEKDAADIDEGVIVVGRAPGSEGALEMVSVSLHEGAVKVERGVVKATTIGQKSYASTRGTDGDGKPTSWWVVRYDVPEPGTLRVLTMNEVEVAQDVRGRKVAGSVQEPKPGSVGEGTMVTLSATVEALRAYLASRGDAVYRSDKPLVLKRLRLR